MESCAIKGIALWNVIIGSGSVVWAVVCYNVYGWNAVIPHSTVGFFNVFCFGQLTIAVGLMLFVGVASWKNVTDKWLTGWLCLATVKFILEVAFVMFVINDYDYAQRSRRLEVSGRHLMAYLSVGSLDALLSVMSMIAVAVYQDKVRTSGPAGNEREDLLEPPSFLDGGI
ncbi:hypothetical protein BV898_10684 [Hypsibius exemplaris]|uniref:MARVEL domain-containing protein n=1 Tax=Hypsibius exemplaris TaxID=2072580 RepID=A0A1W0WJ19_HYPEX|nr:hypothetical protein BV898_10684 [Hypsibius exemplaris]